MFDPGYELLDFGDGRKLERFAEFVVDRPCSAAQGIRQRTDIWRDADARFTLTDEAKPGPARGAWKLRRPWPRPWSVQFQELTFELKASDFGHLGVFPEQADNWRWIAEAIRTTTVDMAPCRLLNLFAHTGGSTLAAAAAGAEVTHVDAAANVVKWARRNAERSQLTDAPIRWIAEDATKFAARELKRGRRYNAIVLDPPSYGHGPSNEVWQIGRDLGRLLSICRELLSPGPHFVLLTAHAAEYSSKQLGRVLRETNFIAPHSQLETGSLFLLTSRGNRQMPSGEFARVVAG